MSERVFETIDGNFCKADNLRGYCLWHDGILTDKLIAVHKCRHKNGKNKMCDKFCPFNTKLAKKGVRS